MTSTSTRSPLVLSQLGVRVADLLVRCQRGSGCFGHVLTASLTDIPSMTMPRVFFIHVDSTLKYLQENEDTDGNFQITIEDGGAKVMVLGTKNSNGRHSVEVRGTYALANLMQELWMAQAHGRRMIFLHEDRLTENPVTRLSRLIKNQFWEGLRRVLDGSSILAVTNDPKAERMGDGRPRIYVPEGVDDQLAYYQEQARLNPEMNLDVCVLPRNFDAKYVKGRSL